METPQNRHIEITPGMRGGKPYISGTRISVSDVVVMHLRLGQSIEEISGKYDIPLAAVYAAIAYYYDHKKIVDQDIEADRAFAEAFRQNNPSLLKEKLQALSRG